MSWAEIAGAAGSLLGDLLPHETTRKENYGFMQSPEMKQWLQQMEANYGNLYGTQNAQINQAINQLGSQYAMPSNYLASILGGSQLTPQALQSIYQPFINAANVANQAALGNVASRMNKSGVGGSSAAAGAMSNAQNATNAALGQQLAELTQAALNRQMQAAQLAGQIPGWEANTLANLLGTQQNLLRQGYGMAYLMPQLGKTGETQVSGLGFGGSIF